MDGWIREGESWEGGGGGEEEELGDAGGGGRVGGKGKDPSRASSSVCHGTGDVDARDGRATTIGRRHEGVRGGSTCAYCSTNLIAQT